MDRQYIQDHQVIERYLQKRLSRDEEQAFEEAYLGDAELLDELERAQALRDGLRTLEAEGDIPVERPGADSPSLLFRPLFTAAASIALVVSLSLSGFLYLENLDLRSGVSSTDIIRTNRRVPVLTTRGDGSAEQRTEISAQAREEFTSLLVGANDTLFDEYRAVMAPVEAPDSIITERAGLSVGFDGNVDVMIPTVQLTPGRYQIELAGRMDSTTEEQEFVPVSRVEFDVVD